MVSSHFGALQQRVSMKLKISLVLEMLIFYWNPLLQSVYMHLCKQVLIKDTDFVIGFVD